MYCDQKGAWGIELYRETISRHGGQARSTCPRYDCLRAATRRARARGTALYDTAAWPTIQPSSQTKTRRNTPCWAGHDTATRARLGAPGALAVPVWVFYAHDSVFDLVFDSVLFLSHRLDPVHEHCSLQNFSKFFLN